MHNILNNKQKTYIANLLSPIIKLENIKNENIKKIINLEEVDKLYNADINDITTILKHDFSDKEAKSDGITFTPLPIVKYMYEDFIPSLFNYITKLRIADLSVGNGAFFVGLIILLKEKFPNFSVVNFIENNLFGYDLKKENIFFTKLNLYILALYYGENPEKIIFNLFETDTLKYFKNSRKEDKFDLIVGNPPYVKQQNIDKKYRTFLLNNFETISSNYNLYYAFIELSIELLNENGISLQLVPNYLLKIKSAQNLRDYLLYKKYISKIVNFNANKIFDGIDTYSMIIELTNSNEEILYKSLPNNQDSLSYLYVNNWNVLSKNNITHDSINLIDKRTEELVNNVQKQIFSLDISTGIATQKDKLFLIDDANLIDDKYMIKLFEGKKYLIEKESVVRVYKGSGQEKGNLKYSYIIYPYLIADNKAILKSNEYLSKNEPMTYKYFIESRKELSKRSGINEYDENWYRYGRTQSLNRFDHKILFPTNSIKPNFNLILDKALFFNGYAIYGLKEINLSDKELKALEIILNSKLVEIFMLNTSYFISSGYVSYQKKYIEKVTIPILSDDKIDKLLELNKANDLFELNRFIFKLYDLKYEDYL